MPKHISRCPQSLRLALWPFTVFGLAALLSGPASASVKVSPAENGYDIDIDGEASTSELIDAIAGATGVEIKGQPEDTTVSPNHLRNTSLERALRKLLPKVPFAVRFDSDHMPETIIFLSPSQDGADTDGSEDDEGSDPSDEPSPADEQDEPEDNSSDSGG